MNGTIESLLASIIDLAGEIGVEAEAELINPSVKSCEFVLHLRDAQQSLNRAQDTLRLALARQKGNTLATQTD